VGEQSVRILYLTLEDISLHKGSVVHIKEVIAGLKRLGHYVTLIAFSSGNFKEVDQFYNLSHLNFLWNRIIQIKRQPYLISSIVLFVLLWKILYKCDVIYARDYHTVIIALIPRLIFKKRLVFEINGLANEEQMLKANSLLNRILSFLIRNAERLATKYSDRIVSVTPQIASYLVQHFCCSAQKIEIISNGVNTKAFHPIQDQILLLDLKQKLGIKKEEMVIAFVGNLAPWQGVDIFIESALKLLSNEKRLKFLIVGDGLLRNSLMKMALDSGYGEIFIFAGMVSYEETPSFINISDVCVAPFISKRNRKTGVSPLKIFEYMACGKPVVASRVEGLEFIENEGVGWLTEPGDVKDLKEAFLDLLRDKQKRATMGSKGLALAREKFTWDSSVIRIDKILKELACYGLMDCERKN
jgi:glycosyltransferase involved in cell wall biosynthesis